MSAREYAQVSFSGGEISPRLAGRADLEVYRKALSLCDNWEPTLHGSIRKRHGTVYVRDLTADGIGSTEDGFPFASPVAMPGSPGVAGMRLLPFRLANETDHLLALGDRVMRLYAVDGTTVSATYANVLELVANGAFEPDGAGWSYGAGSVTFGDSHAVISSNKVSASVLGALWQPVTVTSTAPITLRFKVTKVVGTLTGSIRVTFATLDPATWWNTAGADSASTQVYSATLPVSTTPVEVSITPPSTGTFYLCFQAITSTSVSAIVDDVSMTTVSSSATGFDIVTPWGSGDLADVQVVTDTAADRIIFVHPSAAPYYLQRVPGSSFTVLGVTFTTPATWTFGSVPFTSQPAEWVKGNWPSVAEIYQGRLWLGGLPNDRRRLWGSRSGRLFDFTMTEVVDGTPVVTASCALDVKVATKGALKWLRGGRVLLIGTDLGEHSVVAQGGAVSPLDIQVRDESAFGSTNIQAVHAGPFAVYVSGDRKKVRAINYDLNSNNWTSLDLTFPAEHITGSPVRELVFARDPRGTLLALLEDGTFAACTIDAGEKIAAWWRLDAGEVISAATTHTPDGSIVWLAVARGTRAYLERLQMWESEAVFVDSAVTAEPVGNVLSGLGHLEGRVVQVVNEGAVEPEKTVRGGQVRLERPGAVATAGLPYVATARTLPPEVGPGGGTGQRTRRRVTKLLVRLNNSCLPRINGYLAAADRSPSSPMNQAEPLFTGDVQAAGPAGNFDRGTLELVADFPLRAEVLALYQLISAEAI